MGWGVGVLGLVAIKVLASGFYANQDVKTPMWIAFGVLITTQLLNLVFVPMFAQAGLSLSIGVAAMLNALALLIGLIRRGSYKPQPGWWMFSLQVLAGSALMAILLMWASQAVPWLAMRDQGLQRVGWFALTAIAAALLYFAALWAAGLKLRALFRH
jgi:putative peptidoglycan lipid II flippase